MLIRRYFVRGRVQGVGFRRFVEKRAKEIGVRGWVKNLADGRVEVFALGSAEQQNQLETLLRRGPESSQVEELIFSQEELHTELNDDFEIRYSE